MRADAERRAKAFNTAVAAAVGRIRGELEAERSSLAARFALLHHLCCSKVGNALHASLLHAVLPCLVEQD